MTVLASFLRFGSAKFGSGTPENSIKHILHITVMCGAGVLYIRSCTCIRQRWLCVFKSRPRTHEKCARKPINFIRHLPNKEGVTLGVGDGVAAGVSERSEETSTPITRGTRLSLICLGCDSASPRLRLGK